MKPFNMRFLGLALVGLILSACSQLATYDASDLIYNQSEVDNARFNLSPFGSSVLLNAREYEGADCSLDCIVPGSGEYFVKTDTKTTMSGGGGGCGGGGGHEDEGDKEDCGGHDGGGEHDDGGEGGHTKEITYRAYNTESEFIVEVDFNIIAAAGGHNPKTNIKITIDGVVEEFHEISKGSTVKHSIPLDEFQVCKIIEFSIQNRGAGPPISWENETYNLFDVCCSEESFSYQTADNLDIKFFLNLSEHQENVEVKFTFPQIVNLGENGSYTAPDGKVYAVNKNGKSKVYTWVGDVSCVKRRTSFHFIVEPDCNANGKAIIWTDTSVNGESVKNDMTPNIVATCVD